MIPERIKYKKGTLSILDQREIPYKIKYFEAKNVRDVHRAIKEMMVRGAPLIGDAAAFGYLLGLDCIIKSKIYNKEYIKKNLKRNFEIIKTSRPTAVSLFKAVERTHFAAMKFLEKTGKVISKNELFSLREVVEKEAFKILNEDIESTIKIAENGINILKKNSIIITYCNTGSLATAGIGTALGIITEGYKNGFVKFVFPCETRPYLQGARLTAWELLVNKIPFALICDNMAGWIMKTKKPDAIIIGADRIAANGDTANKIGSYSLAILAKEHKIPFFVAAPTDTFDLTIKNGDDIKIEERGKEEVIKIKGNYIAHPKVSAVHPAFDVVPGKFISAIITEKGIIRNPDFKKIKKFLKQRNSK
ncbi:MAG: S-methyl-5-thioribose-1-phosphate isomerase [Elusimicrobiota bacterium]